jgi:hypothetical protein
MAVSSRKWAAYPMLMLILVLLTNIIASKAAGGPSATRREQSIEARRVRGEEANGTRNDRRAAATEAFAETAVPTMCSFKICWSSNGLLPQLHIMLLKLMLVKKHLNEQLTKLALPEGGKSA